jgi:copper homeostasis protein (lipoprotein)
MFTYLADAASIELCGDGRRVPVAMEGDYRALEAAYVAARKEPGQALLARVEGAIASRPSAEESQPPRDTLVVQRFVEIRPDETCEAAAAASSLRGTYWKLKSLGDAPVEAADDPRAPHLVFDAREPRVAGSGGCNRIMGGFELDGDTLRMGPMAGTMMACESGMEQEQRFLQSLAKVARYRIEGRRLELLDAAGAVVARFEAAAPR